MALFDFLSDPNRATRLATFLQGFAGAAGQAGAQGADTLSGIAFGFAGGNQAIKQAELLAEQKEDRRVRRGLLDFQLQDAQRKSDAAARRESALAGVNFGDGIDETERGALAQIAANEGDFSLVNSLFKTEGPEFRVVGNRLLELPSESGGTPRVAFTAPESGGKPSAAQEKIARLTEQALPLVEGDPVAARGVAIAVADGRIVAARDPATGDITGFRDVFTGEFLDRGALQAVGFAGKTPPAPEQPPVDVSQPEVDLSEATGLIEQGFKSLVNFGVGAITGSAPFQEQEAAVAALNELNNTTLIELSREVSGRPPVFTQERIEKTLPGQFDTEPRAKAKADQVVRRLDEKIQLLQRLLDDPTIPVKTKTDARAQLPALQSLQTRWRAILEAENAEVRGMSDEELLKELGE